MEPFEKPKLFRLPNSSVPHNMTHIEGGISRTPAYEHSRNRTIAAADRIEAITQSPSRDETGYLLVDAISIRQSRHSNNVGGLQ